jgi:hypothetical protein
MTARFASGLLATLVLASIAGCPAAPNDATNVVACWDLNGNGIADPDEDRNGDGVTDVLDCRGPAGQDGADGAPGRDGADASETLYGDGSSGARHVAADARFETANDANQQWTDFSVAAGATLRLQSGAVIRCTGTFTNYGTILIEHGAQGADRSGFDSSTMEGSSRAAALGINTLAAGSGEIGGSSAVRSGGSGGDGISEFEARVTLRIAVRAGSGGGAALAAGGAGGGGVTILAQGAITNFGTILADGADAAAGGGGGGGGVILLASAESIVNAASAALSAEGGAGGVAGADCGPGGGGGGGVIHIVAPVIQNLGVTSVAGGEGGGVPAGTVVEAGIRSGGGGGGGSGGAGGKGGDVPSGAAPAPDHAAAGASGHVLVTYRAPGLVVR